MAHRRLQQGRGEPVHGPGQRCSPDAYPPAAQHPEHGRRRSREADRGQDGKADLRAEQAGHRREQDGGQHQRGVPHQVDALRCIHPVRDQGGQPAVPHGHRRVPHEPGVEVGIMRIPRHHARCGICPQPPGHNDAREQVAARDRDTRPANRERAPGRRSCARRRNLGIDPDPGREGRQAITFAWIFGSPGRLDPARQRRPPCRAIELDPSRRSANPCRTRLSATRQSATR